MNAYQRLIMPIYIRTSFHSVFTPCSITLSSSPDTLNRSQAACEHKLSPNTRVTYNTSSGSSAALWLVETTLNSVPRTARKVVFDVDARSAPENVFHWRGAQLPSIASGSDNTTSTFQSLPRPARVRKIHTGSIVSGTGQSLAGGMIYDDFGLQTPYTELSDLGPASLHI
jgi:hypothetical protein